MAAATTSTVASRPASSQCAVRTRSLRTCSEVSAAAAVFRRGLWISTRPAACVHTYININIIIIISITVRSQPGENPFSVVLRMFFVWAKIFRRLRDARYHPRPPHGQYVIAKRTNSNNCSRGNTALPGSAVNSCGAAVIILFILVVSTQHCAGDDQTRRRSRPCEPPPPRWPSANAPPPPCCAF